MITITAKMIGFTSDGALIIFANRDEFADWAKDRNDYEVWSEPKWLFNTLREQEKQIEEYERDNELATRDSIRNVKPSLHEICYTKGEAEEEVSEATIRAIKAREDERQQKIAEAKR